VGRSARPEVSVWLGYRAVEVKPLKAVVVYESLWGNTAAVLAPWLEGLGPEARALSTAEAFGQAMSG